MDGDRRSKHIEARHAAVLAALGLDGDATIEEVRRELSAQGLFFGYGTIHRFFAGHDITRKKTAHASEHNRLDVLKQRKGWFDAQLARIMRRAGRFRAQGWALGSLGEDFSRGKAAPSPRRAAQGSLREVCG